MSTRGQFNTKNPTIKRILKEAAELATAPSADYHAEPLEANLFEWHFTIRGPPEPSAYAGGFYHGRILLPPQYPLRPPAFRFLTPTGRFEVNREICLSISGHHEETWQPAWGVRTALVAIRSFMDTDAQGQLGGIECSRAARQRMAKDSGAWRCAGCAKSNADIMKERAALVADIAPGDGAPKQDEVPEELRLAYRDELDKHGGEGSTKVDKGKGKAEEAVTEPSEPSVSTLPATTSIASTSTTSTTSASRTVRVPQSRAPPLQSLHRSPDRTAAWIDTCIYGLVAALLFMVIRKFGW
ncbi:hypothetical protein NX059_000974 [Plenodomus lindquistii]|nr:hypothetical protein NX059_000974 [Plenodomus lindquistii]